MDMIDKNKIYFFHNIYGDEQDLLNTMPENVVAVPFGWSEEAESNRNAIIRELNTSIPSIPCVVAHIDEHYADISFFPNLQLLPESDPRREKTEHLVYAKWTFFDIINMEKPWNWQDVLNKINNYHKL